VPHPLGPQPHGHYPKNFWGGKVLLHSISVLTWAMPSESVSAQLEVGDIADSLPTRLALSRSRIARALAASSLVTSPPPRLPFRSPFDSQSGAGGFLLRHLLCAPSCLFNWGLIELS
jgi:hypothetical protein